MSNFFSNLTNLDSIFAAYETGTKKPATGYLAGGADLCNRFAPIEQGSAAAATGLMVNGADLNTYFAAIGTLAQPISGLNGKALYASDMNGNIGGNSIHAEVNLTILNNGTWSVGSSTSDGPIAQSPPTSGTWITSGVASDYDVQYDITSSGAVDRVVTNEAPAWANLGTSRVALLKLLSANYMDPSREASATVRIRIRRVSTGSVVSDNTVSMGVYTEGGS